MNTNLDTEQIRQAIKRGEKAQARALLARLVTNEPGNAQAWLLLADLLDEPQQIDYCKECARRILADSATLSTQNKTVLPNLDNTTVDAESQGVSNATCPCCGVSLERVPKRKKRCPHCGQFIFIRKGKLVTEEDAQIEDWDWLTRGLVGSRSDFDDCRHRLSARFGKLASVNDTIWAILNEGVAKSRDLDSIRLLYCEMATLARVEGKDPK